MSTDYINYVNRFTVSNCIVCHKWALSEPQTDSKSYTTIMVQGQTITEWKYSKSCNYKTRLGDFRK